MGSEPRPQCVPGTGAAGRATALKQTAGNNLGVCLLAPESDSRTAKSWRSDVRVPCVISLRRDPGAVLASRTAPGSLTLPSCPLWAAASLEAPRGQPQGRRAPSS